jgi:hypothetical protein
MTKPNKLAHDSQKLLFLEIKKLNDKIDMLDARLQKHITFIENVYTPLSNSIDKFKKLFK